MLPSKVMFYHNFDLNKNIQDLINFTIFNWLTSRLDFQLPVHSEVAHLVVNKTRVVGVVLGAGLVDHDHGLPHVDPLPLALPVALLHLLAVLVEAELGLRVALAAAVEPDYVVVLGPEDSVGVLDVLFLQYWGESSCECWKLLTLN